MSAPSALALREALLGESPEFREHVCNARLILDTGMSALLRWETHSGAALLLSQLEAHSVHLLRPLRIRPASRAPLFTPTWRAPPPSRVLFLCSALPSEGELAFLRHALVPATASAISPPALPLIAYATTHYVLQALSHSLSAAHPVATPPQLHLWPFAHCALLSPRCPLLIDVHLCVQRALSPSLAVLGHAQPCARYTVEHSAKHSPQLDDDGKDEVVVVEERHDDDDDDEVVMDDDEADERREEFLEGAAAQSAQSLGRFLQTQRQSAEAWAVGPFAERVARKLRPSLAMYVSGERQQREHWPLLSVVLLDRTAALLGVSQVSSKSALDALFACALSSANASSSASVLSTTTTTTTASSSASSSLTSSCDPVFSWDVHTTPAVQAFAEATSSLAEHTAQIHRRVLAQSAVAGDARAGSASTSSLRRARQSQTTQLRQAITSISAQDRTRPECDLLITHVQHVLRAHSYQKDPCFQECVRLEKLLHK
jgi:hypothetical protein